MIKTWNSLSIDAKSTADKDEFQNILERELLFRVLWNGSITHGYTKNMVIHYFSTNIGVLILS